MNYPSVLEKEISQVGTEKPVSPRPQKSSSRYRLPRMIFWGIQSLIVLAVLGFIIFTAQDLPPLTEIENPQSSLSTQVIAGDGVVLDNFYTKENRVVVKLNDISPFVIDALIATEDARFYQHSGVDYYSIPAIVKRNLTGTTSGGSTITMQLARNLFNAVSRDRTVTRKIKEVIVSAILEKNYTKQEIIEAYLNTVNIYGNAYGIEMASQRLFGKSSRFLTIEEAASMIGMLKGQGVFDPIRNPDRVKTRRNTVINQMVRYNFLDPKEVDVDSIKELPLVTVIQGPEHVKGMAPYFRQHVRSFMHDWCRKNTRPDGKNYNLYTDGLKVYTTLDSRMQLHAEAAVREHMTELQAQFNDHIKGYEPYRWDPSILSDLMRQSERYVRGKKAGKDEAEIKESFNEPVKMTVFSWDGLKDTVMTPWDSLKYYSKFLETGFVSIDPSNGQVKAWVGGIDFKFFKYDHVALGKRQVGSTFKPFVYGAAMAYGYKPCDLEMNQPVVFEDTDGNGTRWVPKNANGKYGGRMTLRSALATSTNLITARLMKTLTPHTVAQFAYKMGIKTPLEAVPALCLGTTDLSVLELTGAYGTFANQGIAIDPICITRIEDSKGNVLEEFPVNSRQAVNRKTAYMIVELLKGVVEEPGGTAHVLRTDYEMTQEIGAKTGTTQNHADGWFMGITPGLVSGAWVGCSDRRMRFRDMKLGQGAKMALPIWARYMQKLYDDPEISIPEGRFKRPRGFYGNFNCEDAEEAIARKTLIADEEKIPTSSDDLDSFE